MPPVDAVSILQVGSSLGFAGLVWYLLAVRDPKLESTRQGERSAMLKSLESIHTTNREERKEWSDTINKISERSHETAKAGLQELAELRLDLKKD